MAGSTRHDPLFGCELWTGRRDRDGYGRIDKRKAHVVAWEAEHGAVAEDFELDHLCRRRACVAIEHLEAVSRAENEKRKSWRYRAKRSVCQRGHSMRDALVTPEGGRLCRACRQETKSKLRAMPGGSVCRDGEGPPTHAGATEFSGQFAPPETK